MKQRLDMILVQKGLASSRGEGESHDHVRYRVYKRTERRQGGKYFDEKAAETVEVRGTTLPYVSRGGLKLEKAMECFDLSLSGKVCMDVGASTGGFTDCIL